MYHLRKCQVITTHQSGPVVSLDPEKFRNLTIPYTGNSEEEFLKYVTQLEIDDVWDQLDQETRSELYSLIEPESWDEFYNSTWHGEEYWHEIGEPNEEWRKTGGFQINHTTE